MKNPLNKRFKSELKKDFGKYFVIFAFLVLLISLVSGFLVATSSSMKAYDDAMERMNVENGHITFNVAVDDAFIKAIEDKTDSTFYDLSYANLTADNESTIRVYAVRMDVNKVVIWDGRLPESDNEIILDRLYAQNNKIKIGDTIVINNKEYIMTGTAAFTDYSTLYESNGDIIFNATSFCVAAVTKDSFAQISDSLVSHNYAYTYNTAIDRYNDKVNADKAGKMLDAVKEEVINCKGQVMVVDFLPQFKNQAINMAHEDMGSDSAMFVLFYYLVIAVIAFIFAVTTANTIVAEAGVIGTLRASGYTKGELIRHYMTLPIAITLVASIVGNILGYTVLKIAMAKFYYDSFSLIPFKTIWNGEAFIKTTIVPIILMTVINLWVLVSKLKLSPIRFLRGDLSKRGRKKAFRLNTKIPFIKRFRIRVLFQNIPNFLTLFLGNFLGGVIVIFGLFFGPMLDTYKEIMVEQQICEYQYMVTSQMANTANKDAEKYSAYSLKVQKKGFCEDEVTIYGIENDSRYVDVKAMPGKAIISSAYKNKYKVKTGDVLNLYDSYTEKNYNIEIAGYYDYEASLAIFISREDFNEMFDMDEDYFTGYFSNVRLDDLDKDLVVKVITDKDITKVADQFSESLQSFVDYITYFGMIMFILLMYLLSKQIIEKNASSISMAKILGFSNGEIGLIYLLPTSIVVLVSLIVTCPLTHIVLKVAFESYIYTEIAGYLPYIVDMSCFVKMVLLGVLCYVVVAAGLMIKINKIPKTDALKLAE